MILEAGDEELRLLLRNITTFVELSFCSEVRRAGLSRDMIKLNSFTGVTLVIGKVTVRIAPFWLVVKVVKCRAEPKIQRQKTPQLRSV